MTEVIKIEKLMFHIEETNKRITKRVEQTLHASMRNSRNNRNQGIQDYNRTVAMSIDICALHPSINKDLAAKTIVKQMKESKLPWDNV